jgi:Questin oxidase-like
MALNASLDLSASHAGIVQGRPSPADALKECNRLLYKNHKTYHMFFREMAGMNHISHSLLTCFALGADIGELQDRYQDEAAGQRPMPPVNAELLEKLDDPKVFLQTMYVKKEYCTFLHFFERRIAAAGAGGWQSVVHEFVFTRSEIAERMFSSMFDGLYHPLIHLGLGIEFALPGIVAEALAQAAANDDSDLHRLFGMCEQHAASQVVSSGADARKTSMLQLLNAMREANEIRTAPLWSDMGLKIRNGVVGRAGDSFAALAGRFKVSTEDEEELLERTAEMISTCALMCGGGQHASRKTKIDFFWMHSVTSSIFMSVFAAQKDWISLPDRARLLEYKVRTDLAWYVASGSVPLDEKYITDYSSPESDGWSWEDIFSAVVKQHDDGHAAKFIRALKNGELVSQQHELRSDILDRFPVRGDMWLKLARMCHDTTKNMEIDLKWVRFTGYDEAWRRPDLLK